MQRWKPKPSTGLWIGLGILFIVLYGVGVFGAPLITTFRQPPADWHINLTLYGQSVATLMLLVIAGYLSYRVLGALTLVYEVDRNGLYVRWLGNHTVIPIEEIQSVDVGDATARLTYGVVQTIGYYAGTGKTSSGKRLRYFSTRRPVDSLFIYTATASYVVSPAEQDGFVQHVDQCRRLGSVKPLSSSDVRGRILFYAFWNDTVIQMALLLAIVLNLVLFGVLAASYPNLAAHITMRFDAVGHVAELRPRHQILFLPLASSGLILFNIVLGLLIYRHEKIGARVLQIASIMLPILFGIAIVTIISRS